MIFENKKTTIRIYLRKMVIASVTVIMLTGIMVSGWFERDVLGISKYLWVIIVTLVYLTLIIISRLRRLNFFYFSDDGDKILIRYYPIHPLVQKKKAIQIPKIGFAGYEIKSSMFGLKKVILLQQKVKGSVAKYPPIGITALNRKESDLLRKHLDKYLRS
ncbi:MAG: hypothetical protein KAT15_07005 [Bacteroidales bacterium]|nr:hypothetical protein [Bacteroidales bacterium]